MVKCFILFPVAFMLDMLTIAETVNPYREKGCVYGGDIDRDGKPSGRGTWKYQDGRSYADTFKDGELDNKGVYTVSGNSKTFIEPSSSNSVKLHNTTLEGVFKKDRTHGNSIASQNDTPALIMKCEDGMIKEVKLAKRSASKTK